jgi:SAM-dependent methyltransferase
MPDDWSGQLAALERDGRLSEPWIRQAVSWLADHHGGPIGHVLDVGSGPGFAACQFAEGLPGAVVTALDPESAFVESTTRRARARGLGGRVSARIGGIPTALPEVALADIVWASHVVHHLPDPVEAMRALGDRIAPGGLLALAEGGLPTRFLPAGQGVASPGFILRLEAALSDYFLRSWNMPSVVTRGDDDWPVLLERAGLVPVVSRTFLMEFRAPVDDEVRAHVVEHFSSVRTTTADYLNPGDAAALDRLLDPADPAALVNRKDLFLLGASTVHLARRAG